ncbi:MAG: class I SAM-dependent methyltransferase [Chloroflexi bacterium]|nr:class I SAM-dependent methyltransferase [Chloroflexota bacterium]
MSGQRAAGGIDWHINYRSSYTERLALHSTKTIWRSLAPLIPQGCTMLEIGCGSGRIISLAMRDRGVHGVGIDVTLEGMRYAQGLAAAVGVQPAFVQGDGLRLPFATDSFDCVLSESVIDHFGDKTPQIVQEHVRVCRPGGRVIVTTPNLLHLLHTYHWLRSGEHFVGYPDRLYSRPGLARLLKKAGLRPLRYSGFSPSASFEWFLPFHPTFLRPIDFWFGPNILSWIGYQTVIVAEKP